MPALLLTRVNVPVADTLLPSVIPLLALSDTSFPLRSPCVTSTPPLDARVRLPLPALMAPAGKVSWLPAMRLMSPFAVSVRLATSRLFLSVIETPAPVAMIAPVKSLPALFKSNAPDPALRVVDPAPAAWVMVPVWVIPSPLSASEPLPTDEVPRINALLPLSSVTLLAPLLIRLTAPVKLLPALPSVMA